MADSIELCSQFLQKLLIRAISHSNSRHLVENIVIIFAWLLTDVNISPQTGLYFLTDALVEMNKWRIEPLTEEACHACLIVSTGTESYGESLLIPTKIDS